MEGSEELESSLLTQPWASVRFGESSFLAKVCFRDTGYILLISDLSSVWYESADAEAVGQRSKELNKRLTVHVSSFLNHLCSLMCPLLAGQPGATTAFSCHRSPGSLRLHVKSELSGLPFYWDFHCCLAPLDMVSRHLVRPLIQMNLVLQCQVQELISLLLQKDAEIEDYRESGATLSRDRLRTEPFREETFQQNFVAEGCVWDTCRAAAVSPSCAQGSQLIPKQPLSPALCYNGSVQHNDDLRQPPSHAQVPVSGQTLPRICSAGEGQAFASALQQLYTAVTQQELKQARKRHCSEDDVETAPSAETTKHPHSPAASQEDETPSSSERTSPASSPAQKPRLPAAKAKPKKAKGLFS
ncbi:non-homologous end-joining factor 1 isoform X3 [Agelaius tricolor]|uniref:non-homologous end-joining factor 1 isoform X3 n=1 Tax=Agelaius tricolor TaxID=9191 RepID=UPI0039F25117